MNNADSPVCPVCDERLLPHELALFHSGKGNLIQIHTRKGPVWVHPECAEKFETRNQLVQFVTEGADDHSWLE